jgi:hypothetical protein
MIGDSKVLICDDDELLVDLLEHRLSARGFDVLVARDGGEAVAVAGEQRPDAIVLDAMMPVMDGHEVLRRLRSREDTASIPERRAAGAGATRWSLDLDGSYGRVEGPQADWRSGSLRPRYRASDSRAVSAGIEAAHRFGRSDVHLEVGIDQAVSERARVYLNLGATPDADFRPRYQIGAGGSLRIRDGSHATVLTLDARQAEYAAGDVQTISPGIEQYLAGGRIWLTARWINLFELRMKPRWPVSSAW